MKIDLNNIYNLDCNEALEDIEKLDETNVGGGCIVTDPPYNVGYHYDDYEDNMNEDDYFSMLKNLIGKRPAVIIHYPEALHKLSICIGRSPDRVISWVYSSNTARQHRDIAFYGIKPDFTKCPQPYKNENDKRIQERIALGKTCKMYDWFECDQIKNVQKEKLNIDHPCIIPFDVMDKVIKLIPSHLVVIDPFCGTGTTCIAAAKNGRNFVGFEKSPKYYSLARRRFAEETAQMSLF